MELSGLFSLYQQTNLCSCVWVRREIVYEVVDQKD
jgi:hypothetical protein